MYASENWVYIYISISISTRRTDKFVLLGYAYVVAFTSENGGDIHTSINTRTWTNHRPL